MHHKRFTFTCTFIPSHACSTHSLLRLYIANRITHSLHAGRRRVDGHVYHNARGDTRCSLCHTDSLREQCSYHSIYITLSGSSDVIAFASWLYGRSTTRSARRPIEWVMFTIRHSLLMSVKLTHLLQGNQIDLASTLKITYSYHIPLIIDIHTPYRLRSPHAPSRLLFRDLFAGRKEKVALTEHEGSAEGGNDANFVSATRGGQLLLSSPASTHLGKHVFVCMSQWYQSEVKVSYFEGCVVFRSSHTTISFYIAFRSYPFSQAFHHIIQFLFC
jgi:hypothetical protein